MLGHSKEIVTADNYINNQEIIADGVVELVGYMEDVLPTKSIDYSETEKLYDYSSYGMTEVFENILI